MNRSDFMDPRGLVTDEHLEFVTKENTREFSQSKRRYRLTEHDGSDLFNGDEERDWR
jgi:hypothetical protein